MRLSQNPLSSISLCTNTNAQVVAAHFLYLAKLLLTAHDPNIPRIGPQMKSALAEMKVSEQSVI